MDRCSICGKDISEEDSMYILEKDSDSFVGVISTFCDSCYHDLLREIEKMKIRRAYRGWALGKD